MAYYGVDEMKSILSDYAQYRDKLYCRGFLITDRVDIPMDEYPFTVIGIRNVLPWMMKIVFILFVIDKQKAISIMMEMLCILL